MRAECKVADNTKLGGSAMRMLELWFNGENLANEKFNVGMCTSKVMHFGTRNQKVNYLIGDWWME